MEGRRKYAKLWLVVLISIVIAYFLSSLFINAFIITEPVYHSVSFDTEKGNGTYSYNPEGKLHISEIELPESIYSNQEFRMKLTIVNENESDLDVWIKTSIPTGMWAPSRPLFSEKNITIEANQTSEISFNCISIEDAGYVDGIGLQLNDVIDYGLNSLYTSITTPGDYESWVHYSTTITQINIKPIGYAIIIQYIIIFSIFGVGCIISLNWIFREDWDRKKR